MKYFYTYREIARIVQRTSIYSLPSFSKFALYVISIYLSYLPIHLSSTIFILNHLKVSCRHYAPLHLNAPVSVSQGRDSHYGSTAAVTIVRKFNIPCIASISSTDHIQTCPIVQIMPCRVNLFFPLQAPGRAVTLSLVVLAP